MPNLPESETYEANIYQLETSDPVDAGANGNGVSNLQAKQLANRSAWLRAQLLALLVGGNAGNPVSVAKGGLGANNSTRPAGQIPFTSAIGVIDWLTSTAYGRSLLAQANAVETAQVLNIGLGKFAFANTTAETITTSTTYQSTGLGVTITPQSTASKILVLTNLDIRLARTDSNSASSFCGLFRGAVGAGTLLSDSPYNANFSANVTSLTIRNKLTIAVVDSPNTTNPVSYNVGIRIGINGEIAMNAGGGSGAGLSGIYALEIIQ